MRVSPEDGQLMQEEPEPLVAEPPPEGSRLDDWRRSERLMSTVVSALDGSLPVTRPLRSWENAKLSPKHIQMCYDKVDGLTNNEIAAKYDMTPSRVCVILKHPDAEFLIGELLGVTADRIADPLERMRSLSHEMINLKVELVRDTQTPRQLKNDIASDFLDRAGYGARQKLDVSTTHAISIPAAVASRLSDALDASRRVSTVDYKDFVAQPKLLEGTTQGFGQAMTQEGQEQTASGGQPTADNGNSPPPDDPLAVAPENDPKVQERIARLEYLEEKPRRRIRIA